MYLYTAIFCFLSSFASAANLPTISIKGRYFFANGERFYIRGIAYQQDAATASSGSSYNDPLADTAGCKRDIQYLKDLNINVIRTYAIDPSKNHDECMSLLNDAGIYVVTDLSQPEESINRNDPAWTVELFDRYTSTIDVMSKYDNVMAFIAANEVINDVNVTESAPFVKAAIRDIKAYVKEKGYRDIPVGYSADDNAETRDNVAKYLDCGDASLRGDFYAINIYEWCGDSTFEKSGYEKRTEEFQDFDQPLFFSEFGCIEVRPRKFTEVDALFSSQMTDVWSGGIVYMYFQEDNDYGVVSVSGNTAQTLTDFPYLSSRYATATGSKLAESTYTPETGTTMQCPTVGSNWNAATNLPNPPSDVVCDCMYDTLECTVKDNVDATKYEDLFGTICGLSAEACEGIAKDPKTGNYGTYQMCSAKYQLSWAMNRYYQLQKKVSTACDFDGQAEIKSANTPKSCSTYIQQAGSDGTGVIRDAPLGTISATGKQRAVTTSNRTISLTSSQINLSYPETNNNSGTNYGGSGSTVSKQTAGSTKNPKQSRAYSQTTDVMKVGAMMIAFTIGILAI